MKKITFLFLICSISISFNAQNTCETAIPIGAGTTTAGTIVGSYNDNCWGEPATYGEWFSYTPAGDGYVTITSNLPVNDGVTYSDDTRISVFIGGCGVLSCYTGNDDIDIEIDNYLSEVGFYVESGTEYLIQWDNYWSDKGFNFSITEDFPTCSDITSFPFNEDWTPPNFACWDNIDEDGDGNNWFSTYFNVDAPGDYCIASASWNESPLTPNNWLISQAIDLTGFSANDNINLTWIARGLDTEYSEENYSVYAANSHVISNLQSSPVFFNETISEGGEGDGIYTPIRTLDISSLAGQMIYVAFRHYGVSDQFILTIDNVAINATTLGIDDIKLNAFSHFYNKDLGILTLKSSNNAFSSIKFYNILGQMVLSKKLSQTEEIINLSNFVNGIYMGKVTINNHMETIKILKQ